MLRKRVAATGVGALVTAILVAGFPAAATAEPGDPPTPISYPISSMVQPPTSYPSQTPLPLAPEDPSDVSYYRGAVPYSEVASTVNAIMETSEYVSAQVVAHSVQGRDIQLVTVTAPETEAETAQQLAWREQIKYDPASAAADTALQADYKVPIWLNGNIHGNEWEGADIILNYIEYLANAVEEDADVAALLENYRFYFTITNNPDGRVLGTRANADGFDANRDMVTGATPEARVIRDLASVIQPTFYIDLHGYTSYLQVEPCGPPHGENYEYDLFLPHAYAAALAIEDAVVAADIEGNPLLTDANGDSRIRIPYRDIRSGWDDWPPIFTPQFLAYQGAITNTVELPLGRVAGDPDESQRRTDVNNEVGRVTVESSVAYFDDNSQAILQNQIEIFRRGIDGDPLQSIPANPDPADYPGIPHEWIDVWDESDVYGAEFPRAYVIPVDEQQRSATDAARLVDQLIANGVDVSVATTPITVDGDTYAAGSYVVDMHQPLRGMANVLLADGSDITERVPSMYDLSAWSLALLWGADVFAVGSTQDASLDGVGLEPVTSALPTGDAPGGSSYLELATAGAAEYQAINVLLGRGVAVSVFDDGSAIISADAETLAEAALVAAEYGVQFTASTGARLFTETSTALKPLQVAYSGNQDDRVTLQRLGFTDLVHVNAGALDDDPTLLDGADVLWVGGNLNFGEEPTAGSEAVEAFLAAGNGVAGKGGAVANFVNSFGLAELAWTTAPGSSNAIVNIDNAEGGLLSTYPQDTALVVPATWYTDLGDNVTVEQSYAAEDLVISGHWTNSGDATREHAQGEAAVVSVVAEGGNSAVLFGTAVNFRTHPVGSYPWIAKALFDVNANEGTPVDRVLAADQLTDENRGFVEVPEEVTIGEPFDVLIDVADGTEVTLYLFGDGSELASGTVVDGALTDVVLLEGTEPGAYQIAALDDSDGMLIGWDDTQAVAPGQDGDDDDDDSSASPTPSPTESNGGGDDGGGGDSDLPDTGGTMVTGAVLLAALLVTAGIVAMRRKRTSLDTA